LVGSIKGAIAWLGGAIAGLTVLCYGAGYFALRANMAMLGLDGIAPLTADEMLLEGGQFWRWLIYKLVLFLGLTVILLMILFMLFENVGPLRRLGEAAASRSRTVWGGTERRFPRLGSFLIVLLALAALQFHSYSFDALRALALAPPQLLFTSDGPAAYRAALAIDPDDIARSYFLLVLLVIAVFSKLLEPLVTRTALIVVRLAVGLYFAVYTLSLPAAFGILLHEPVYSYAALRGEGLSIEGYVVARDGDSVLLWSPETRAVTWIPLRRVDALTSGKPHNIFGPQRIAR
jgi:hypothetical protein